MVAANCGWNIDDDCIWFLAKDGESHRLAENLPPWNTSASS